MRVNYNDNEILLEGEKVEKTWDASKILALEVFDKIGETTKSDNDKIAKLICLNAILNTTITDFLHQKNKNNDEEVIKYIKTLFQDNI